MPNRVVIHPSAREYGSHREQYDALARELETGGVLVRIVHPPHEEGAASGRGATRAYDLVVHVGEVAGAVLGPSTLISLLRERLRGAGSDSPRRGALYLADGKERPFTLEGGE